MRLFKTTYRDRNGVQRKTKKWYVEFKDHLDIKHRWPLFPKKIQSENVANKIEELVGCRIASQLPDAKLSNWIEGTRQDLRYKLAKASLIEPQRAVSSRLLIEHLTDFNISLLADGCSKKQADQVQSRIKKILNGCHFKTFADIKASSVQAFLYSQRERDKKPISKRTYNWYVQAIKQFCVWAEMNQRIAGSPVKTLSKIAVEKHDEKKQRRALDVDDLIDLLEITRKEPKRFGLSGPERAMVYRLAVETGLRANEIRNLTVSSFNYENSTVTVQSAYTKNKKPATLPMRQDTLEELKPFLAGRMPHVQVFKLTDKTANMLRTDLEAAELPYTDASGKDFDFHALRHQQGSLLQASGVSPKVAQELMRHSDNRLTMNIYTHTLTGQEAAAVNALPELKRKNSQQKTAT